MNILLNILLFVVLWLPYFGISAGVFKKYKFILSFGLCFIVVTLMGYILQFFALFNPVWIITASYILLVITAVTKRKNLIVFNDDNKKFVIIFILVFILVMIPVFVSNTISIQGHDITAHAELTRILSDKQTVLTTWGNFDSTMPISYPFAFHIIASTMSLGQQWLIIDSIFVLMGAMFAVFCLAIYPLARELGLDKNKSLIAVALMGFGQIFALYPLVWGGVAQLFGNVMLVFTLFFMIHYTNNKSKTNLVIYGLAVFTLFMAYYWMFLIFCVVTFIFWIFERNKRFILDTLKGGIIGVIILIPWICVFAGNLLNGIGTRAFEQAPATPLFATLLVINPILILIGFYTWNKNYRPLYVWILVSAFMLLFSQYVGLAILNPSRWLYALSIPCALLGSIGLFKIYDNFFLKISVRKFFAVVLCVLMAVSLGYFYNQKFFDEDYKSLTQYEYDSILYSDNLTGQIYVYGKAGTWIPFLTEKKIMNPPLSTITVNKNWVENIILMRNLYRNESFAELGADYYMITEGNVSSKCSLVYKEIYRCGG